MRTRVIWDHGEVRIWRSDKSTVACLAVGQAEDAEALVAFLQSHYRLLAGSRLTILLDHPHLDHRIERIPKITKKLQRQLLEQRQQKPMARRLVIGLLMRCIQKKREIRTCGFWLVSRLD